MKPDYKLFNRMLPAVVLVSSAVYMPNLRRNLADALDGGYNWIDSPKSDAAAALLKGFDDFRLFSFVTIFLLIIVLIFLQSRVEKHFAVVFCAGLAVFAASCAVFSAVKGFSAQLVPYLFEQGLCSAAVSAVLFMFPPRKSD